MTPLEAVTATNPYPFYGSLLREKPLYFDEALKMWVASDARFVMDVLKESRLRVRPETERIPNALIDLRSGAVFGSLMRMTDGSRQCPLKSAALDAMNDDCARECSRLALSFTTTFKKDSNDRSSLDVVRRLMFLLPTYTIGACLGVPFNELDSLAVQVSAFVVGISPLATSEQRMLGDCASQTLSERLERLVDKQGQPGVLLKNFQAACTECSIDQKAVVRNLVGFLFQTYDAAAGLIGNALLLLARNEELRRRIAPDDTLLRPFLWEVLRFDPSVQNTRRFAAEDVRLGNSTVRAGEQVLVVLAAANRDPSRFANPDQFDLHRAGAAALGFGSGKHECPGKPLAVEIACASLQTLLTLPSLFQAIPQTVTFRPSANARIPLF
jgi:cytochrome P450